MWFPRGGEEGNGGKRDVQILFGVMKYFQVKCGNSCTACEYTIIKDTELYILSE